MKEQFNEDLADILASLPVIGDDSEGLHNALNRFDYEVKDKTDGSFMDKMLIL